MRKIEPPIVILGPPRSGTSMIAGIFAAHGVWFGTCRKANAKNLYGFFESIPLKGVILRRWGALVHKAKVGEYQEGLPAEIHGTILGDGYPGGPWGVKMSTLYWKMYLDLDPTWILVRRDPTATKRSGKDSGYNRNPDSVDLHYDVADGIRDHHGGIDVYTDDIVAGDYTTLEEAFHGAGIDLDHRTVEQSVDRNVWHDWGT